jgi:hypothetical protein
VGKVSLKAKPVRVKWVFGLNSVRVRLVLWVAKICAEPKALLIVGTRKVVMPAVPAAPEPPLVEPAVTEFICTPSSIAVTPTENVQLAPAAKVAPARMTAPDPAVAVMAPPPQLPVNPFGVDTAKPSGSVSVNATPIRLVATFGLWTVKLKLVLPPTMSEPVPNALVMVGGATTTMLAEPLFPVPPLVDVTSLVVLFTIPATVPMTLAVMVQVPDATIVALLTTMLLGRPLVEKEPHPVPVTDPVSTRPDGRTSLKPTPVKLEVWFGFEMVKVNATDPSSGTEGAEKAFEITGGKTTRSARLRLQMPRP